MLQQQARGLGAACGQCHLSHTLDLEATWACSSSFLNTNSNEGFIFENNGCEKHFRHQRMRSQRWWRRLKPGNMCLHVPTKQNQTRRATGLWMKPSRHRSRPTIHLSFNRKVPSRESSGRSTCTHTPEGKPLKSSLDTEAALVRPPGTRSPVCWNYSLVVTGKDEWMS